MYRRRFQFTVASDCEGITARLSKVLDGFADKKLEPESRIKSYEHESQRRKRKERKIQARWC